MENLLAAWKEFKKGKERKADVQEFSLNLEDNIFSLRDALKSGAYRHSHYISFFVRDPKLRHIHKATVRDRVLHHAIVKIIEPIFERLFIFDSYSSRKNKGMHQAITRFRKFAWKLSQNNTKTVWVLKCDIRKFFDSVDQETLIWLIRRKVEDGDSVNLIKEIIHSFKIEIGKGIPLGNVTSQLFSNIYLNELDQFVKRELRIKYYIRYADDFVILSGDINFLEVVLRQIEVFLKEELNLKFHADKISIGKWHKGIDFLGYVVFPHHILLRTKTKRRMFKRATEKNLSSYLGVLKHCRSYKLKSLLVKQCETAGDD